MCFVLVYNNFLMIFVNLKNINKYILIHVINIYSFLNFFINSSQFAIIANNCHANSF